MNVAEVVDIGLVRLVELDKQVDGAENDGIRARWEFGKELLARRVGKQLPNGLLDALAEDTGKSRGELKHRMRFAERFSTKSEVDNAIIHFGSWFAIVNKALASTAHLSSTKDEWATPQALFDALDAEFGFTLDVCASSENAKCERFFSSGGLEEVWEGTCWMNPPYSEVSEWMEKALETSKQGHTVVCLVPSRTDVGWFWDYARQGELRFLRGRVHFVDDEGNTGPAPFPSVVVVFGAEPGLKWWDYERS